MTVVNFSLSFRAADARMSVNNACWDTSSAALCQRTRGRQEWSQSHRATHFLSRLPFPGPKRPPGNQNPHNAKAATLAKRTFNCELKLQPYNKAPPITTHGFSECVQLCCLPEPAKSWSPERLPGNGLLKIWIKQTRQTVFGSALWPRRLSLIIKSNSARMATQ